MRKVIKLLATVAIIVMLLVPGAMGTVYAQGGLPPEYLRHVQQQLRLLGKTTLTPEELVLFRKLLSQWRNGRLNDIPISADPAVLEINPTVAANPVDPALLVAGSEYHNGDVQLCAAYTSSNGGASWSEPYTFPQLSEDSECGHPVVAYSPDGSRVYYAYADMRSPFVEIPEALDWRQSFDFDILVSTSEDHGLTWSEPVVALDGEASSFLYDEEAGEYVDVDAGFNYLHPWISVPLDSDDANWVYVTATRRTSDVEQGNPLYCAIDFASSNDGGTTWGVPVTLEETTDYPYCEYRWHFSPYVDGSRPAGGMDGNVLVAWYNSGPDGYDYGEFEIHTRSSSDHGVTWNDIVIAATDLYEQSIHFKGLTPSFPDVEIDAKGGAHIAYSHDPTYPPEGGFIDAEFGDIRYVHSSAAPYDTWSEPVTVNDDGTLHTQSWPALETQLVGGNVYVYLMWADFRNSPTDENSDQETLYDVYSSWKRADSTAWSANHQVTDTSSLWAWDSIGDYFDLTASQLVAYGVWTDRRDMTDVNDPESDVYGSWILPFR